MNKGNTLKKRNTSKKDNLFNNLKNQVAEQFRNLRTNIEFSSIGDEIKSIVVTSSLPFEGKSTVISNLAVAMASSGKKVVIVDCNLIKPNIHKRFSLSNYKGLTNVLTHDEGINEAVMGTDVYNLYVIPSGPMTSNPSELLGSRKMKEILAELTNDFDMVLIDSPSILVLSDAQILSALSQGTIIVTSYGKSEKDALIIAKEKIERVGGKIIGVVINKIPDMYNRKYRNYYSN